MIKIFANLQVKSLGMVWLPILMAIVAAWGIDQYLETQSQAIQARVQVPEVIRLVAGLALQKGTTIAVDHLATRTIPASWVGDDSFEVNDAYQLEGMVLQKDMVSGQPFARGLVAPPVAVDITSRIGPGRRALTIPVDYVNAISGLLKPGDLIDLFVTFEHEGKRMTTLLVSAVRVLATDQKLSDSSVYENEKEKQFSSVTLDVSPNEAVKLVSARQDGVLTAVLRVDKDQGYSKTKQPASVQTGHLAGFAGVDPSFGKPKPAAVIYGDLMNGDEIEINP